METLIEPGKIRVVDTERTNEIIEMDPYFEITPEESRKLRYAYRDGALARNSEVIGRRDSTSIFVSREFLEAMLQLVDEAGPESAFINPGVLIHWAAFPMDYPDDQLAGRHTIVVEGGSATWLSGGTLCPPFCGSGGGGHCLAPLSIPFK
jgi:hypothetical protein